MNDTPPLSTVTSVARQSADSARPNVSTGLTANFFSASGIRRIGAEQQQARARHQIHQPAKRQSHGIEIGVNVCVIELDVIDDGDVREILQELRGLVEEGAVVLVAFDHEVAALAEPVARPFLAEISRDAADKNARVQAAVNAAAIPSARSSTFSRASRQ